MVIYILYFLVKFPIIVAMSLWKIKKNAISKVVMSVTNQITVVIFWILVVRNISKAECYDEDLCRIRFYDRKYFKGSYWTLDARGKWNSSWRSALKDPYGHFQIKSIRLFCSNACST